MLNPRVKKTVTIFYENYVSSTVLLDQHYSEPNNMSQRLPANESARLNGNDFLIIKLFMENKQEAIWKQGTKWRKYLKIKIS
jgi:hypothetical protein